MASRRPGFPGSGSIRNLTRPQKLQGSSICPFCSITPTGRTRPRSRRQVSSRRFQSTSTNSTNPRAELEQALLDLQKHAPAFVNLSRLQLALQGLRQTPGRESVRVAILGLTDGSDAGKTAKNVLRVLLADPLKDEEEWEQQLKDHDPKNPLIIRVGPAPSQQGNLTISKTSLLSEVNVSSVEWNGLNLEILFMQVHTPTTYTGAASAQGIEDALLVPTVNIPSAENRVTPVTTPVHKSLIVADGLMGAVNITPLSLLEGKESILTAVDLKGLSKEQLDASFEIFDVALAEKGVGLLRKGPQNAMEYNHLWSESNVRALATWINSGISTSDDSTKPVVRQLIASLLQNTLATIQTEESGELSKALKSATSASIGSKDLNEGLAAWAQKAHAELQDELDLAFTGHRWSKLGWWQLFWRVDDVAMLTNEMLSQRFLPTAEQELVYLTGRISEFAPGAPKYPQPSSVSDAGPPPKQLGPGDLTSVVPFTRSSPLPKWPGHIAFTRRYLQNETIPALQALAQRLVVQSLGTSGITTSLAGLLYISSFSSTIFEAGAVAALGIVWSLSRLQKKWESARAFWEGEVREEGRKAVRGAEESVAEVLDGGKPIKLSNEGSEGLEKVKEIVTKAEDALSRMK
ncbi:hypothetical protein EDB81DRAFT_679999 [Dactylonectria macrodidyma]|uniref:Mmc1 C-terminal domain-containing protein n=1 Tax=Dactylonectria macrodidyma TaxID=307937 RepID=A0A9P9FMA9_9HYPO|nr:hypothetical protein EDB81DRAFT_679999 [Dactylonectria macrodidyma]